AGEPRAIAEGSPTVDDVADELDLIVGVAVDRYAGCQEKLVDDTGSGRALVPVVGRIGARVDDYDRESLQPVDADQLAERRAVLDRVHRLDDAAHAEVVRDSAV